MEITGACEWTFAQIQYNYMDEQFQAGAGAEVRRQNWPEQRTSSPCSVSKGSGSRPMPAGGPGCMTGCAESVHGSRQNGIFFGCSLTVTRINAGLVTSDTFVREMLAFGARVFVFIEYVPIEPGTEVLVLDDDQHTALYASIDSLNRNHPALFIGFPGDEAAYGGCLAAGRGFIHVSASGDLEACPAAPFSDTDLARVSLDEALRSPLLSRIRSHHHLLTETNGGSTLWTNRAWVDGLVDEGQKRDT